MLAYTLLYTQVTRLRGTLQRNDTPTHSREAHLASRHALSSRNYVLPIGFFLPMWMSHHLKWAAIR
jgi:hypothetical protein